MASVTELAQHIRTLSPEKDAARLSFYQYLIHLAESTEAVTAALVNRFFTRALQFEHWRTNKTHLFEEVYGLLGHFSRATGNTLALEGMLHVSDIQAVQIDTIRNLELAVAKHLERTAGEGTRTRVIRDGDERVIGVVLRADRGLRVTLYPKVLAIRNGELLPLHDELTLHYSSDMNLQTSVVQELDLGSHAVARFVVGLDGLRGTVVRGYTFQAVEKIEGGTFEQKPALFYPLKRIEQFFIDRRTDPVYQDLTASLEKALELVSHQHPEGERYARWALDRSRFAFEHIYSEDKLVRLISNLERRMTGTSMAAAGATSAPVQTSSQAHTGSNAAAPIQKKIEEDLGVDLVEARSKKPREEETWPEIVNLPV